MHGSSPETVAEAQRRGGIASGETRRELAKSGRQLIREELEAEVGSIVSAFRDGTKALASCPHCRGDLPDVRARIQAAAEWLNQSYGKPVQPTREEGNGRMIVVFRPAYDGGRERVPPHLYWEDPETGHWLPGTRGQVPPG